jgi:hypothetical protein
VIEVAGSIYVAATAAFVLAAIVVGVRLIGLHRRTRQAPEGLLGWGLLCSGGLGYGLMIFAVLADQAAVQAARASQAQAVTSGIGWVLHNVGVLLMLRFVVMVYRPDSRFARGLAVALGLVLWTGWLVFVIDGGLYGNQSPAYWVALGVIGSFPVWSMVESYAYWRRMKRRLAIGLADPLVCNRFLLWTLASVSSLGSIWMVNVPLLVRSFAAEADLAGLTVVSLLVTAVFGIATVSMYWLTFFPPAWYRDRIVSATAASHA